MPPKQHARTNRPAASVPRTPKPAQEEVYLDEASYAIGCFIKVDLSCTPSSISKGSESSASQNTVTEIDDFSAFDGITPQDQTNVRSSPERTESYPRSDSYVGPTSHNQSQPLVEATPEYRGPISQDIQNARAYADSLKHLDIDFNSMMLYKLSEQLIENKSVSLSDPSKTRMAVGELKEADDVFAFLHRFEMVVFSRNIPESKWLCHLAPLLTGRICEVYYNSYNRTSAYADMRATILQAGGYSLSECLDTYNSRYRHHGSQTLHEWYTHTKYKYEVILDSLPFLFNVPNSVVESMAKTFALVGVLAILPPDRRDFVLNKEARNTESFLKDCMLLPSWIPDTDHTILITTTAAHATLIFTIDHVIHILETCMTSHGSITISRGVGTGGIGGHRIFSWLFFLARSEVYVSLFLMAERCSSIRWGSGVSDLTLMSLL